MYSSDKVVGRTRSGVDAVGVVAYAWFPQGRNAPAEG